MEIANLIHSYSRREAIEDGVLIDVSDTAREAGIRFPTALTAAAWAEFVAVPPGVEGQDEAGRLWDILWMFRHAARFSDRSQIRFQLHVRNDNRDGEPPLVTLKAIVGPGDDPAPVITIMLPNED